ncbi:hypothetical protein ACFL6C_07445 [Myxococcota bacterium]
MAKKTQERSQLLDLFLHVADQLGAKTDREVAELADVGVDNIANWRAGTVREIKAQTLRAIKENLATRFNTLREQLRIADSAIELGLIPVEIEEGSGPTALQRQFVDRMVYDYLGHRFLYFEPQGALAWENLIKNGYEEDSWLAAVRGCVKGWTDTRRDASGWCRGPIASALGWDRRGVALKGLDIISLGPGEGGKEVIALEQLLAGQKGVDQRLSWLTLALVDVSIPLLITATKAAKGLREASTELGRPPYTVLPFCADFEEGPLSFVRRLPSELAGDRAVRLVMVLGNVFGNVRDEETFLRQKLLKIVRPGDLLWLDVGVRPGKIEQDPLFRMTESDHTATAAFSARRLLLEGPYRRWEAAIGRPPTEIETRVWIREGDDTCRVPGSVNFCHDLVIKTERRVCTMLYSRRYDTEALSQWLEAHDFDVERIAPVEDSRQPVVHLLCRRR